MKLINLKCFKNTFIVLTPFPNTSSPIFPACMAVPPTPMRRDCSGSGDEHAFERKQSLNAAPFLLFPVHATLEMLPSISPKYLVDYYAN